MAKVHDGGVFDVYHFTYLYSKNVIIENNSAGRSGGAVSLHSGIAIIENNTIINNKAKGGGAFASNGNLTIYNSLLVGNNATSSNGGVILINQGRFTSTNNYYKNNSILTNTSQGTTIYVNNTTEVILNNNTFEHNIPKYNSINNSIELIYFKKLDNNYISINNIYKENQLPVQIKVPKIIVYTINPTVNLKATTNLTATVTLLNPQFYYNTTTFKGINQGFVTFNINLLASISSNVTKNKVLTYYKAPPVPDGSYRMIDTFTDLSNDYHTVTNTSQLLITNSTALGTPRYLLSVRVMNRSIVLHNKQFVNLYANMNNTLIYYTENNTTPTVDSTLYDGSKITVSTKMIIKFMAVNSKVETPVLTYKIGGGPQTYVSYISYGTNGTMIVALSTSEKGTNTYYTTNGNNPITSGIKFTENFITTQYNKIIKAYSKDESYNGPVMSFLLKDSAYVTLNTASAIINNRQNITLKSNQNGTIYYSTDGSNVTKSSKIYHTGETLTISTLTQFKARIYDNNNYESDLFTYQPQQKICAYINHYTENEDNPQTIISYTYTQLPTNTETIINPYILLEYKQTQQNNTLQEYEKINKIKTN